jgi:nitrogen fixation NifU-like protein
VAELTKKAAACFPTVSLQTRSEGGLEEVVGLVNKPVAEALGGLPAQNRHCSNLCTDAVRAAIEDHWSKQKGTKNDEEQSGD